MSISVVEERGIYAPMTSNGDIVVNDVLASCYNVVNNKFMQGGFFQVSRCTTVPEQGVVLGR